jgi:hypothetical protein
LPGPCEYGQRCSYFNSTATTGRFNTELAFHLARCRTPSPIMFGPCFARATVPSHRRRPPGP